MHRYQHRPTHTLAHELTAARAYALWQRAGRPEGRDWEFWFAAEAGLRREYGESLNRRAQRSQRGELGQMQRERVFE